jgi:hypothetical protein
MLRDPLAAFATTTARGLGHEHQQQRARLLADTPDGMPCPLCHQPMYPQSDPSSVHADHTLPRSLGGTIADRLVHARCNMSRGNGTRRRRPPRVPRPALVVEVRTPTNGSRPW